MSWDDHRYGTPPNGGPQPPQWGQPHPVQPPQPPQWGQAPQPPRPPQPKKSQTPLIIGLIVGLLVLTGGIGGAVWAFSPKKPTPVVAPSPTPPTFSESPRPTRTASSRPTARPSGRATPSPKGGSQSLGNGASFTVAQGWTVKEARPTVVVVTHPSGTALAMESGRGTAKEAVNNAAKGATSTLGATDGNLGELQTNSKPGFEMAGMEATAKRNGQKMKVLTAAAQRTRDNLTVVGVVIGPDPLDPGVEKDCVAMMKSAFTSLE